MAKKKSRQSGSGKRGIGEEATGETAPAGFGSGDRSPQGIEEFGSGDRNPLLGSGDR